MRRKRFILHATNVHTGGGASLLRPLLINCPDDIEVVAQLDTRIGKGIEHSSNVSIRFVVASIFRRIFAEWWLAKNSMFGDIVLCFGNLPPLFMIKGHVLVFIQNRYLIDNVGLGDLPLKTKIRLMIERVWMKLCSSNVNEFIVQTESMKRLLDERIKGKTPVSVLPFLDKKIGYNRRDELSHYRENSFFDFIYVASGEAHKNHKLLIEAWCLLAVEGIFPSLVLTLDRLKFNGLCSWLDEKIKQYDLNVYNKGHIARDEVLSLYDQSGALIYPSKFESFGLPLIEARQAGLQVLASELDYVRDVLDPEQTFNPDSAISIVRSVKRFLRVDEPPLPLLDATGFLEKILEVE